MQVLATVMSNEWTPTEILEPREIWGTDSIMVAPHWVAADTLRTYCERRLRSAEGNFEIRLLRELRSTDQHQKEARFGVAVLAIYPLGDPGERKLREEISLMARLIKDPESESTLDISEVDQPEEKEAAALRQQLVAELKARHGGMKLRQSLEIYTNGQDLVKLAGTLLERPDDPCEEVPSQVRGRPEIVCFGDSWVKLKSTDHAKMRKLFVSDVDLLDQIVEAGKKHEVVTLQVRMLDPASGTRLEATACKVEARNADPLTS